MAQAAPPARGVKRERLNIEGTVQGIGFRPFVYRLAREFGLSGYVRNTANGVIIEVEGADAPLAAFRDALVTRKPPLARFVRFERSSLSTQGGHGFTIRASQAGAQPLALILPDLAVCDECLREMHEPSDRRYRYPFINCINCGPRFSIITALPYDRPNTTMAGFRMCPACQREYDDPGNRRYHAQAIACPECGPQLELRDALGIEQACGDAALLHAAQAVHEGKILALKGMGGFHLVCDARHAATIAELRRRKRRPAKPFAVMYPSLDAVRGDCVIQPEEALLLRSAAAPLVLLRSRGTTAIADNVAPANPYLGVMLPYTPLHQLLLSELGFPIVATSGNRADEPVCTDDHEALHGLRGIADLFLVHDRPIAGRCDDSIVRVMRGHARILRRARGYAPLSLVVNRHFAVPVLGVGGHLKNTVALAFQDRVFLAPHVGNLDTPEARAAHRSAAKLLCRLYKANPKYVACDLHPDYGSTRMAGEFGANVIAVQHQHAHALACMAENGTQPPCLAVAWDGAGYGTDGTIWGGEFLRVKDHGFERSLHLLPFPLPGGDAAALDPKRAALGILYALLGEDAFARDIGLPEEHLQLMKCALRKGINCPQTSSVGRLFDAIAALSGICTDNQFEGQAAMALEFAADPSATAAYDFDIEDGVVDWRPMLRELLTDIDAGREPEEVSGRFHATLAAMIVAAARIVGEDTVLLTGGCFQNSLLLQRAADNLEQSGFTVHTHRQLPPNDGGLAVGQVIAIAEHS